MREDFIEIIVHRIVAFLGLGIARDFLLRGGICWENPHGEPEMRRRI
jgi:hypothetical protein